ncbi:MAG: methylated-DNA--[]-cysteine S-methyltransferase family protein [Alphaproteobacteria bacterium]|nr:methylated-DNA--[]-cysteine S-methyltransferase family protein [Alphaproteobacteria bacterium]
MSGAAFALFPTAIGACALVWRDETLIGAALPETTEAATRARIGGNFPDAEEAAPPAPIAEAIALVARLLAGEAADLSAIPIDLGAADDFERSVYAVARAIPRGEVRTYGEVAAAIGIPGAARAVGAALGRNPIPIIVPCHRVLAAAGRSGGFSAPGGTATKFRMLAIEGARRPGEAELFDSLPLAVKPA